MGVRNRFKGLDLIDRVPDELWTKVCDRYRRQGSRPSQRKRNEKRQNVCLRRLKIAVKRRKVKSKGEEERQKHLNAEFQRIARREKKAFISYKCKK